MTHNKPNCKDFILAAIRTIRLNPSNLKEGTKAGTSLHRLYAVASEVYSEEEFREGLEVLVLEKVLVAVWRIGHVPKGVRNFILRDEIIQQIPREMPLDERAWHRGMDGKPLDRTQCVGAEGEAIVEYDFIRNSVKLFIAVDGLPLNVTKLQKKTTGVRASQIIAQMQRSE